MKYLAFFLLSSSALAAPTALQIQCKSGSEATATGYAVILSTESGPFTLNPGALSLVSIRVGEKQSQVFKASYLPSRSADKLVSDVPGSELSLVSSYNGVRESNDYLRTDEGLTNLGECSFTVLP